MVQCDDVMKCCYEMNPCDAMMMGCNDDGMQCKAMPYFGSGSLKTLVRAPYPVELIRSAINATLFLRRNDLHDFSV